MRGGASLKHCLVIIPCLSSSSRRCERVLGLIPTKDLSKVVKRLLPPARSLRIRAVHLFPIIAIADATQPEWGSMFVVFKFILYFV